MNNVVRICECVGPVILSIWLYSSYCWLFPGPSVVLWILNWVSLIVNCLLLLLILDIYRLRPYGNQTLRSLRSKYMTVIFARVTGTVASYKMYRASRNVERQQNQFLKEVLQKQKSTEYGRKHGFDEISSSEEFRSRHPVTTYSHFKDYMERSARGERNVLMDEDVTFIGMTSGTTGRNKIYPIYKATGQVYMLVFGVSYWYIWSKYPRFMDLRSCVSTRVPKNIREENGVKIGPVSAMSQDSSFNEMSLTPAREVNQIYDERKMMYIHAVFGLRDRNAHKLELSFVSIARSFFHCLETQWQPICDDIELGKLSLDLPKDTIRLLESSLSPEPVRAEELRREFRKGFQDIAPRVWPHLAFVTMLTSGPLAGQAKALSRRYLNRVPVLSTVHISTEGIYGVNKDPGNVHPNVYTLIPLVSFFEFIPLENADQAEPDTMLMHQVELGKDYEIVITNSCGLYRYRSGDVIRIVSYYNQIPQYEFQFRLGQMLNVYGERSTEGAVQTAVENLLADLDDVELVDYTCVENSGVDDIPALKDEDKLRYYVVFIEVDGGHVLTDGDRAKFDEYLCAENEWYGSSRLSGNISPASVFQVQRHTFIQLKELVLQENYGTASTQFKMPRVQRKVHLLKFLAEQIMGN